MRFYYLDSDATALWKSCANEHLLEMANALLSNLAHAQIVFLEDFQVGALSDLMKEEVPIQRQLKIQELSVHSLVERLGAIPVQAGPASDWARVSWKQWKWSVDCLTGLVRRYMSCFQKPYPHIELVHAMMSDGSDPDYFGRHDSPMEQSLRAMVIADRQAYFADFPELTWNGQKTPDWWRFLCFRKR
jgi:hypothetical protein